MHNIERFIEPHRFELREQKFNANHSYMDIERGVHVRYTLCERKFTNTNLFISRFITTEILIDS